MVLDAEDLLTRRVAAINVLLPTLAGDATAVARLVREGRVMLHLAHPTSRRVLDCGALYDGRSFIVKERLFGETLRTRGRAALSRRILGVAISPRRNSCTICSRRGRRFAAWLRGGTAALLLPGNRAVMKHRRAYF